MEFTTDWFSHSIPTWEKHLQRFAGQPSLQYLEVGSWEGRSACWLLEHILTHPDSHLTCIDTFTGNTEPYAPHAAFLPHLEDRFDANIRSTGVPEKVTKLKGLSADILRTLPADMYDLLYIDGDHAAHYVLTDAVLGWPLLRSGGILIFDDYVWGEDLEDWRTPRLAINTFLSAFREEYTVLEICHQVLIQKH